MLISYKNKFIFLHNYKVAGSSVNLALKKYAIESPSRIDSINKLSEHFAWSKYLNTKISNKIKLIPTYNHHVSSSKLKAQISYKIWNSFFKFGFVRNPWDWQVSLYNYMLQRENHFQHKLIKNMKSFDEYIEWRVNNDLHLQKDFFCDKNGVNLLDYVGKLENIEHDFKYICEKINIDVNMPHVNKSNRKTYKKYYNSHTKKIIEEYFIEDIELFNYDF